MVYFFAGKFGGLRTNLCKVVRSRPLGAKLAEADLKCSKHVYPLASMTASRKVCAHPRVRRCI